MDMPFSKRFGLIMQIMKGADPSVLAPSQVSSFDLFGTDASRLRAEYEGWVYACVNKIATSVSSTPLRLWRRNGKDRATWEEIDSHELIDLLDAPNDLMDRQSFLQYVVMHQLLTGASYCWMIGVKDDMTKPEGLFPLDPTKVKINAGKYPTLIENFTYSNNGKDQILSKDEVIYTRHPDPRDQWKGVGPAQGARDSILSDESARTLMQKWFANGAIPSVILKSQSSDPTSNRLLRESYEDHHGGVQKSYRVGVLPPGVEIAKEATTGRDMEFSELRRVARDEILAMFGVPAPLLGLGLGETVNRASMDTLEYIFAKYTVKPECRLQEAALNRALTYRYGDEFALEFDDPVPENVEQEMRLAEVSLGRAPFRSINEVRASMGYPSIGPEGDQIMGSSLLLPVGTAPAKSVQKEPKNRHPVTKRAKQKANISKASEAIAQAIVDKVVDKKVQKKKLTKETDDWQPKWEAFVKRTEPKTKDMRIAMAHYAKGMTERAVDKAKRSRKAVDPTDLLDTNEEVSAIVQLTAPIYQSILVTEGKAAADLIGEAFDAFDQNMQDALEKSINLMASKYNDETLALLQEKLRDVSYENMDDVVEAIQTIGEFSERTRAERVARTESYRTANFASKEAWKQSGVVKTIKWYTAEDERVCEDCGPLHGETIGIDETFFDKGDELPSGAVVDYTDVGNPPLHVNCVVADTHVIAPDAEIVQKMAYSGDIIELTLADGRRLSVTPNHPILTLRGFVAARLLKDTDEVISLDGIFDSDPNNNDAPTTIREVFDTLQKSGCVTMRRVPVTAKDFHGDGHFGNGNIDIVSANGLLLDAVDAETRQKIGKFLFNQRYAAFPMFSCDSDLATVFLALAGATDGLVSCASVPAIFSSTAEAHHLSVRLKDSTNYNARLDKATTDGAAIHMKSLCEIVLGLSGAIKVNNLVSINRKSFHGEVYDVSTTATVYSANGFITSNCRCYTRPEQIEI